MPLTAFALQHAWAGYRRRLSHAFGRLSRYQPRAVLRPLLSQAELSRLMVQAAALQGPEHQREIRHGLMGEQPSAYLGRGLDFEELRRYVPGDDVRAIEWRTTARTGVPHVKVFRESRQPLVHVVVDRGPSMRFGTRRRLKVSQAVSLAALFAFTAMGRDARIGGRTVEPAAQRVPSHPGRLGASLLMEALNAPCPPLAVGDGGEEMHWREVLRALEVELAAGAQLVLLSDFRSLSEQDLAPLSRLAAQHDLVLIQVLDPVDLALPDVGMARFRDLSSGAERWLDTADVAARERYRAHRVEVLEAQTALLRRIGVRLWRCTTEDDPLAVFEEVNRHG